MTKTEFNKAKKYLKTKLPYYDFEITEKGQIYKSGSGGSDADFLEISVRTLFDIVNELLNKKS